MAFQYRPENPYSSYGVPNESQFQVPFSGPPPPYVRFNAPTNTIPQNPAQMLPPNTCFPSPYPFQLPPTNTRPSTALQPYDGFIPHLPPTATNILPPPLSNNWNVPTTVLQQGVPTVMQSLPPASNLNPNLPPPPNIYTMPPANVNFPPLMPNFTTNTEPYPANDGNTPTVETSVENEDARWIESWTLSRSSNKTSKDNIERLTVCNARLMLKDALQTLSDLKMATGFLNSSTNVDEEMWQFKLRKAQKLQGKLNCLISQFSSETILSLKKQIRRIQNKRERVKRQRLSAQVNKQQELENREKMHAAIDAWRNEIQERVLGQKKKEELKLEADNVLSEVRKKLQEAKKSLEHLDLLERLRSARLDSSEKKGLKVSSGSTAHFNERVQKLRKLMIRQLNVYEAEEHALKVMLETEREQEAHERKQEKMELCKAYQNETLQRLFGKPPDPTSPLFVFWQFYMQGHANMDLLVQIRHEWDMYLTPQDDPGGSPVPIGWVLPVAPSSNDWKTVLDSESLEPS